MFRVAVLSLPWGRLAAAAVLLGILMDAVRRWPWSVWPLEGIAVGLLAAAVAWCLDEPAGAVVDAAPRPLWWRTVARSVGVAGLVAVWTVAVWSARHSLFGHPWEVWNQGLTCSAVAVAWATLRRSMGARNPGIAFAVVVVPVAALWALMRPFEGILPVFPYADGDWTTSTRGWIGVAVAALAGLALVLSDFRWWRAGTLPVRRKPPPDRQSEHSVRRLGLGAGALVLDAIDEAPTDVGFPAAHAGSPGHRLVHTTEGTEAAQGNSARGK